MEQDENNTFLDIVKKAMPEKLIANFIVVAEMVDGTNTELSIFVSESMTPWLAGGMLQAAMDLVADGQHSIVEDDDDDDEGEEDSE